MSQIYHQTVGEGSGSRASSTRMLSAADFTRFAEGTETGVHELLGAHPVVQGGEHGIRFSVWAPRADAVFVLGDFNEWTTKDAMRLIPETGVWELFLPGVNPGSLYKLGVRAPGRRSDGASGGREEVTEKADPVARLAEVRPNNASRVPFPSTHFWTDAEWMQNRALGGRSGSEPISIYEVHLGSWRRQPDGGVLDYRSLAEQLLPYARDLGFTHVEIMPLTEYPYDESWGYQATGYFAPTARYGGPDDFRFFVDQAHKLGLGVILDWVPGHFASDSHGLRCFDGQPLYELKDPEMAVHPDWGTLVFDYERPEVISFLVSCACYWLDEFHIDGLRVDAVASMLYLDYSRPSGTWKPNAKGGRENLGAVRFLRRLTQTLSHRFPGVRMFAEESTSWPGVTARPEKSDTSLGFDFKWNMGWMNDTLLVARTAPARRSELHHRLTFSISYTTSERHLLPLSHDEVVHGKGSLLAKMPGTGVERLAGLRLLFGYMWTHPGGKLLFMGGELGQWSEWNEGGEIAWELEESPEHAGVRSWVRELNRSYRTEPSLHAMDHESTGFEWLDVHDAKHSVLSYIRWADGWDDFVVVVANFAGVEWPKYRVPLPAPGFYEVILDSGDPRWKGPGCTEIPSEAEEGSYYSRPASLSIDLPPLTILVLKRRASSPKRRV